LLNQLSPVKPGKSLDINAGAETKLPYAALCSGVHYIGLAGDGGMTLVPSHPVITVSLMSEKRTISLMPP
jgi:hypothetical protein